MGRWNTAKAMPHGSRKVDAGVAARRRHDRKVLPEHDISAADGEPEPFGLRVERLVRRVPYGRVVAYGGVAAMLGAPRAARGVGAALSRLPPGSDVPWWRVVNARGGISLHGHPGILQRMLLEAEGVRVSRSGIVDMKRFGWRP